MYPNHHAWYVVSNEFVRILYAPMQIFKNYLTHLVDTFQFKSARLVIFCDFTMESERLNLKCRQHTRVGQCKGGSGEFNYKH